MALARRCAWCGGSLEGKGPRAKTCSDKCRSALARKRAENKADRAEALEASSEIRAIVRHEAPDVVTRVMKDELAPIVREAIDEDVLRAIKGMLGLTPAAVAALEQDLASEDLVIRQRAYSLVIKYTVGNQALKPDDKGPGGLKVIFNLPRPDEAPVEVVAYPDGDGPEPETKVCDICSLPKPLSEFVGGSDRCSPCFTELREQVLATFSA